MNENKSLTYEPYVTSYEEYIIEKNTERSIGRKEGIEMGAKDKQIEIAENMINQNLDINLIANCTNLPINKIQSLMNKVIR